MLLSFTGAHDSPPRSVKLYVAKFALQDTDLKAIPIYGRVTLEGILSSNPVKVTIIRSNYEGMSY